MMMMMMMFKCCLTRSISANQSPSLLSSFHSLRRHFVSHEPSKCYHVYSTTRRVLYEQLRSASQQTQQQKRPARPVPPKFYNRPNSKSVFKAYFKLFVVLEVAAFFGSYYVWKRMNSSQEFRFYMSKSYPSILEGYYQIGEKLGNLDIRAYDNKCWQEKQDADSTASKSN